MLRLSVNSFLLASMFLFIASGCTTPNALYCDGPSDCTGDSDYCDISGTYSLNGLTNTCVPTPEGNPCNSVEDGTCAMEQYCIDGTRDGQESRCVSCLEDKNCVAGGVCDKSENRCVVESCASGAEGNLLCSQVDDSYPICGSDSSCVQCVDGGDCLGRGLDNPHCDALSAVCGACVAHDECLSGACDFEGNKCVLAERVVHVNASPTEAAETCGESPETGCLTILEGLTMVLENADKDVVVIQKGNYPEFIVMSAGNAILVAAGAVTVNPSLNTVTGGQASAVALSAGSLSVYGITFSPQSVVSAVAIVSCTNEGAELKMVGVGIIGGDGIGVSAVNRCSISISESTIADNGRGGINIDDAPYELVNNFIVGNGSPTSTHGGVTIENSFLQAGRFDHNTVADNSINPLSDGGAAMTCRSTTLVANGNILHGSSGTMKLVVLTPTCSFVYSLFQDDSANDNDMPTGQGNMMGDPDFEADYHLISGSPGMNEGDPNPSVLIDFDGDLRPQGTPARSDMGADEFVPPAS